MIKNFTHIEVQGKKLKTEKEFIDFYQRKLSEFTKEDSNFLELPFAQNEKKWVNEMLQDFEPANKEAELFKNNLFRYSAGFLNGRLFVAQDEFERSPSQYESSLKKYKENKYADCVNWFAKSYYLISDFKLRKDFIKSEITRTENALLEWATKMSDLHKDLHKKAEFLAGEKYIEYLKAKEKTYQNIDSIAHYYSYYILLLDDDGKTILPKNIESPYQIDLSNAKCKCGEKFIPNEPDEGTVLNGFGNSLVRIFKTNPNEIENFLEYHLQKYQGQKKHWLRFSKLFIKDRLKDTKTFQDELQIVLDWFGVNEKKIEDENTFSSQKASTSLQAKGKKPEHLIDIWIPDREGNVKKSFDHYIDFLKRENNTIASPFVIETHGKLQWIKQPRTGWVQYLAAFIYTCIKKGWVTDNYSAPQFQAILKNTFQVDFNPKPFKQLTGNPPLNQYLKPFSSLPANI